MLPTLHRPASVLLALAAGLVVSLLAGCGGSGPTPADLVTVGGRVTAGPTCPVERIPPDPACAPRPVVGAVLVVDRPDGSEAARTTSGSDGRWALAMPPGSYVLVPQPAAGLMGRPGPIRFEVAASPVPSPLDVGYDTGIR